MFVIWCRNHADCTPTLGTVLVHSLVMGPCRLKNVPNWSRNYANLGQLITLFSCHNGALVQLPDFCAYTVCAFPETLYFRSVQCR